MRMDHGITYDGLALFSSGPSRVEPGEHAARDAVMQTPGAVGAAVIGQGTEPRTITQRGMLVADHAVALQTQISEIAAQVGRTAAPLIDEQGNTWDRCVMRSFRPGPIERLGPRVAAPYTITYLQTHP